MAVLRAPETEWRQTVIMDKLTPSGAVQEVLEIARYLSDPRITGVIGSQDFVKQSMQESLCKVIPSCEITIWENSLWGTALKGSEAFDGLAAPISFCKGPSQIWMFAEDMSVPEPLLNSLSLSGEWVFLAHVFLKSRTPKVDDKVWRRIEQDPGSFIMKQTLRKMLEPMLLNEGKWGVAPFTILMKNSVWIETHPEERSKLPHIVILPAIPFYEGDKIAGNATPIIAAHEFMNSTVAIQKTYQANHQVRKQFKKLGIDVPAVNAVVLRRAERIPGDGSMRSDVEWSCQWLVRGHWRRLHDPRKSDGVQVVYIQPHAKGPQDKPFRAPRETVFVARR